MTEVVFLDLDETLVAQERAFRGAYRSVACLAAEVAGVDEDSFAKAIPTVAASCLDKLRVAAFVRRCCFGGRDLLWGDPSGDTTELRELAAVAPAYRADCWSTLLARSSIADCGLGQKLDNRFRDEMTTRMAAFDDVRPALDRLHSRYRLAIITNGMPAAQFAKVRRLGLDQYFDRVIASAEIGIGKPAREIFQYALKRMNTSATQSMMVGDSLDGDIAGAQNAGMRACWMRRAATLSGNNTNGVPIISDLTGLEAVLKPHRPQRPPAEQYAPSPLP